MSRLEALRDLNLQELLDLQLQYHRKHALCDGEDWVKHSFQHLVILTAKMSRYFEQKDHDTKPSRDQLQREVVPDLLFWFFETMIGLGLNDPASVYADRITANIKRDIELQA